MHWLALRVTAGSATCLLLLYCCFTAALLLPHTLIGAAYHSWFCDVDALKKWFGVKDGRCGTNCCCPAALLLLCFTAALLLLYYCFTADYSCFTAGP